VAVPWYIWTAAGGWPRKREGMDVSLEGLDLKTLGVSAPVGVERKRELRAGEKPDAAEVKPLTRVTQRHRSLAQAVARNGDKVTLKQIALEHGIIPSTLYRLCQDLTFKEMVAHFRADLEMELQDAEERMVILRDSSIDVLQARLDEDPDSFTVGQLTQLMTLTADRTGLGPSSKTDVNVNVGFAQRLNQARTRARQIEVEARDVTPKED
jgi:hypothetical protein